MMSKARGRKSIFITGAASGIGAETARFFAAKGWFIGLFDVNAAGLDTVAGEIGSENCITGVFDVRDREGWARSVKAHSEATEGRMNVLFNNAGIARYGWFEDIDPAEADAVIDINVKGVINGVYAALPLLRETSGARIVNVASVAGLVSSPKLAVYSASKFAVRGLTEGLDIEMSRLGVKVVSLMPWFIDTPILDAGNREGSNETMKSTITNSGMDVYPVTMAAERAWDAVHGKDVHYTVGKTASRSRFLARFMPGTLRKRLLKSVSEG